MIYLKHTKVRRQRDASKDGGVVVFLDASHTRVIRDSDDSLQCFHFLNVRVTHRFQKSFWPPEVIDHSLYSVYDHLL